ncbi:MAG: hypothetical protein OXI22_23140 [Defluviicoccus sp.]|nr:hypothetical protein [Defluviicoccus sp.]
MTAYRKTKETLESEAVTWELHPGTDIARNWTVVTAAYSGLEQTLKYLIAEEKGLTIPELIDIAVPGDVDANQDDHRAYPYRTHNSGRLFSKLAKPTQDIVRDFYRRYRSLHSYVAIGSAGDFLNRVSGSQGTGYERWRYTLIEDKPLPKNSPEALVAIWGVCVRIAEERLWKNRRVRMPDKELTQTLCRCLEALLANVSVSRQNAGEPFQDISGETRDWLWRRGHPLNAFAEVLWHFARYGSHGEEDVSEWLSEGLTRWVNEVVAIPSASARTSLRAFLTRAQGHTPDGQSIRWNPSRDRFEAVRWSLEQRFSDTLPAQATVIGDPAGHQTPLATLWVAARDSGYRVLENRAFKGPAGQDIWFRTLEVRAEGAGTARPILSIWQQRNIDDDLFCMVSARALEEVNQPLRNWMDLAQELGEMKSE